MPSCYRRLFEGFRITAGGFLQFVFRVVIAAKEVFERIFGKFNFAEATKMEEKKTSAHTKKVAPY
jgi:hypothetical protein